jgi:hypothetical protein
MEMEQANNGLYPAVDDDDYMRFCNTRFEYILKIIIISLAFLSTVFIGKLIFPSPY